MRSRPSLLEGAVAGRPARARPRSAPWASAASQASSTGSRPVDEAADRPDDGVVLPLLAPACGSSRSRPGPAGRPSRYCVALGQQQLEVDLDGVGRGLQVGVDRRPPRRVAGRRPDAAGAVGPASARRRRASALGRRAAARRRAPGRRRLVAASAVVGHFAVLVVDDLGVDHLVVRRLAGGVAGAGAAAARAAPSAAAGLVQLLGEGLAGRHQGLGGVADGLDVAAAERLLEVGRGLSSTAAFSSPEILSPCSLSSFSVW